MSFICRVNTKTKTVTREEQKEAYKLFGGRSLIAKVMTDEVDPHCDPLGSENKLILCTSLLAGSTVPMVHRLSVGGKSPLTGGIKEANSGGTAATMMARHNIKAIILEDLPETDDWLMMRIQKDGTPELISAVGYVGLNNYALVKKLQDTYGNGISVISIGTAGERGFRNSTLQVVDAATGYPSRAAARGGLGAVMGSKRIKAVVIEKSEKPSTFPYADKKRYDKVRKLYIERLLSSPMTASMQQSGTISMLDFTSTIAALPTRNFSGEFFEKANAINSKAFVERVEVGGGRNAEGCTPGCLVRCSNRFHTEAGEYITSGLEYETVALCGSNCGIGDLDVIARMDQMCDDLGVDTIETGATIAVCMEAGKTAFGDADGALALLKEMFSDSEFGSLMGQGTATVGKALGVKRIPTVKGQSLPAYDPRNIKGLGVTYSTSTMGADHTAGMTMKPGLDHMKKDQQVETSAERQISATLADSMMCSFGWAAANSADVIPELMASLYGGDWDFKAVQGLGRDALSMERAFNKGAGFTAADDRLPEFFYTDKSATGTVFDITDEELAEVFNL